MLWESSKNLFVRPKKKGRQNFGNFFENLPPPPPSRKAFIHDYLFLHRDLSVAYYYVLSVLTISRGGFREGCEGGWADALFFQGFDPLTKHWVHICTIFLRFFCTENFLRVPLAPIFTIFEWETHAKKKRKFMYKNFLIVPKIFIQPRLLCRQISKLLLMYIRFKA